MWHVEWPLITDKQFQWTGNGYSQLPLAELGKPSPNIDLLRTTGSNGRAQTIFTVWPWPWTYDHDLQPQASQSQGRPSCQKSKSKVKRFKQESVHRQMDGHTHTRTHMDATKHIISPATRSIINQMRMMCASQSSCPRTKSKGFNFEQYGHGSRMGKI